MPKYNTGIVLINYNSLEDTVECVKSILSSESPDSFIVIVDNASRNTAGIGDRLAAFPDVKVLYSEVNVGFGRANNIGINWLIENTDCDHIFILNNDTIVEKDSIAILERIMAQSGPDVGLVAPKILVYSNPDEVWYGGGEINYKRMTPTIGDGKNSGYTHFASGCAMFFRKDVLKTLNGFDPFFFMYDEDVELSMRVSESGKKIWYEASSVILHKCQGSQTKETDIPSNQLHPKHPSLLFYLKNTILNRRYIIDKHLSGSSRFNAKLSFTVYWLLKSAQYFVYFNFKAGFSVFRYLMTSYK
jgi:GT2 family glycosyltransferase